MYYIWFPIYEMYSVYVYRFIFRVLFVWSRLVSVHENREPSDLLGPWVPYLLGFKDLFLFLAGREECSLVSFQVILVIYCDSIPGEIGLE